MANWNLPGLTDTYTNFLTYLKDRDLDAMKFGDGVTITNPVTGMKRWNPTTFKFEKYTGSAWADMSTQYVFGGLTVNADGTVSATAPAAADNTAKLATTSWVVAKAYAPLASPTFTGTPAGPTAAVDTNTTQLATTAFVIAQAYAKLASPTFTGTPSAPTAATGTNTAQLATTAFVNAEIANDAVTKTGATGAAALPAGTTAERPTAATGQLRFNTTLGQFEGYNGSAWGKVGGGATGGGTDDVFVENGQTVSTNYTITSGKNAMSAGPITVANGVTVTVPNGSTWTVV